jgi:hypothetical protein
MPSQNRRKLARQRVPQQIDLFAGNAQIVGGMPAWSGLPTETQAALPALMMRLILDHAVNRRSAAMEDGPDL